MELRTARANSVPHGTIRFGRKPSKWTPRDRALAMALTVHEDSLCPHCGQPRDRSWNEDMDGYYTAHRARCMGCQAVHLEQDSNPRKPAETIYVTDDAPDGYVPDSRMMPR